MKIIGTGQIQAPVPSRQLTASTTENTLIHDGGVFEKCQACSERIARVMCPRK